MTATDRIAELERENAELRKELIAAKDSLFKAHTQNWNGLNGSAERTCNEGFKRAYKFLNPDAAMQSAGEQK